MAEVRPDPDQLLAHVQAEEARAKRGRLRIFFGASAGVGKTYAMLEAAAAACARRHGCRRRLCRAARPRATPSGCSKASSACRRFLFGYRGIVRQEFDLDAALKRRPAILLVDELAHSNLVGGEPAPRHPKRWQDVEELLDAGINVWTTVNVQHLESLNDLVAQITGVRQRETLPDRVFDEADDIELIDLPPDDLLARLRAGKVYIADEVATRCRALLSHAQSHGAARARAAPSRRSRRGGRARTAALIALARALAGDRVLVAVGPGRAGRAAGARRQAHGRCARCGMDRRVRRDAARCCASRDCGAQPPHRCAAPGRVAGGGDRHIGWSHGGGGARSSTRRTRNATRVIVGAPKRARLARVAASLDRHRADPPGPRLRCDHDRAPSAPRRSAARAAADGRCRRPPPIRWDRYGWALATTRGLHAAWRSRCIRVSSCPISSWSTCSG